MGVAFEDIQRHLTLLAQAFAGEPLLLEVLEDESVDQGGQSLRLPARIDAFEHNTHNTSAFRIELLREVLKHTEGTHALPERAYPDIVRPDSAFTRIYLALEFARLDALLRRRYAGARSSLARVRTHALSAPNPELTDPFCRALWGLNKLALGQMPALLSPSLPAHVLNALAGAIAHIEEPQATARDSAEAALKLLDLFAAFAVLDVGMLPPKGMAESAEAGTDSGVPAMAPPSGAVRNDQGQFIPTDEELFGTESDDKWPASARHSQAGRARAGRLSGEPKPDSPFSPPGTLVGAASAQAFFYDEWDYLSASYRRHWCRLFEQRLPATDFGFWQDARRRHGALFKKVRSQFARIRPEAWLRVHATADGDELELDRLIEAVADRRAGFSSDGRVYRRYERGRRDVAAAFLLDMSASTDIALKPPAPRSQLTLPQREPGLYLHSGEDEAPTVSSTVKRCVLDVEKDAMLLMGQALQTLGDDFAIYGFSGDGRQQVEFCVAKDFKDRVSSRTWAALAAMRPKRSTRMGPAIRHAAAKLSNHSAALKVLIIVSDGYPEDSDYGPDRGSHEYGIQDTAQALRECARFGIVDFCVTVDPSGHDYLKRMCSPSRYLVIDDVAALPDELTKVYRTLTS
jgi:hypothetical protein